eukprot:g7822.t1
MTQTTPATGANMQKLAGGGNNKQPAAPPRIDITEASPSLLRDAPGLADNSPPGTLENEPPLFAAFPHSPQGEESESQSEAAQSSFLSSLNESAVDQLSPRFEPSSFAWNSCHPIPDIPRSTTQRPTPARRRLRLLSQPPNAVVVRDQKLLRFGHSFRGFFWNFFAAQVQKFQGKRLDSDDWACQQCRGGGPAVGATCPPREVK